MIYNNMQEMKSKLYFKGLVIALISIIGLSTSCVSADAENQEKKAKYIFLFIGDGMGTSHVAATESYLSYKAGKVGGEMLTMSTFPVYGYSTTYSADSHITCSAAGGTAIACGQKTKNPIGICDQCLTKMRFLNRIREIVGRFPSEKDLKERKSKRLQRFVLFLNRKVF